MSLDICTHPSDERVTQLGILGDKTEVFWEKIPGLHPSPEDSRPLYEVSILIRPSFTITLCKACGKIISRNRDGGMLVSGVKNTTYTLTN